MRPTEQNSVPNLENYQSEGYVFLSFSLAGAVTKESKMVLGRSSAKLIKSPRRIFSTKEAGMDGRPPPGANPTFTSAADAIPAPGARPERVPTMVGPTNRNKVRLNSSQAAV